MNLRAHLPDAIIIGNMQKEKIYGTIEHLRSTPSTRNIPLILAVDVFTRDLKYIGLGPKTYGKGISGVIESLEGEASNAVSF